MIELRESLPRELEDFVAMESGEDTAEYILPYTLERHHAEFARDDIIYLSILRQGELAGFFILALESDPGSIEFRRIVIADKGAGTGQQAIPAMEEYCRDKLGCRRVWLDVFEDNLRGRHVYQKLGYRQFDRAELNGKPLLYFHKAL